MRRIAFILIATFAAACAPTAHYGPVPPPPPPPGTPIRVTSTMALIECSTSASSSSPVVVSDTLVDNAAPDGAGDVLKVRPRGARRGTTLTLQRQSGAYRAVSASASAAVTNAVITLNVTDCTASAARMTVVRHVAGDRWEDVGDGRGVQTISGRRVISTGTLNHLSIYALAGGN